MIFLEDFIAMNSPLQLAPRQQTSYSTLYYDFTVLSLYVMLSSVKFFSLTSPKWIDNLLSTNQSHAFENSLFKTILISATCLCWLKILVSSTCRYAGLFDKACHVFMLIKETIVVCMQVYIIFIYQNQSC